MKITWKDFSSKVSIAADRHWRSKGISSANRAGPHELARVAVDGTEGRGSCAIPQKPKKCYCSQTLGGVMYSMLLSVHLCRFIDTL